MKTYYEIKKEWEDKNYSISELKRSIIFFSIIKILFTELFFFLISTIPFLIGFFIITSFFGFITQVSLFYLIIHIIFYQLYVKRIYLKDVKNELDECEMIIKVLKEIKKSKS